MILNLSGEIEQATFDKLIEALNQLPEKELLTIYMNSTGGHVDWAEAIINLVNENEDRIQLIAFGEIDSAAFNIFFKCKCIREILPETVATAHFTGVKINVLTPKINRNISGTFFAEWSEISLKNCLKLYKKLGFTDEELKGIEKGDDIYFQADRLIEFLNNSNIGKHNEYIH